MGMFIGVVGATALVLWSLACWATVWLLTGSADFVDQQLQQWSPWWPEAEPAYATLKAILAHFGSGIGWSVWAVGALLLGVGTWVTVQAATWLRGTIGRSRDWASATWPSARSVSPVRRDPPPAETVV